ncbi:serine hydrolase domain-containing protein [Glycomyces buryatensis]|uniref:Beta-lactamase family protein n=1 Tax=Glycomyces buryatensis TaxID=2570927 RepID=A0A4S8QAS6_9ACTN|nr:serine hydrolase domain-containing protein [Glycomyces buryatensis]THV41613.1 beta-lactamase family protein [Glycomyces buryatensis]
MKSSFRTRLATAIAATAALAAAATAAAVMIAPPAFAQDPADIEDFDGIDDVLADLLAENDIPGAAVTVATSDTVETYVAGVADVASQTPVDAEDTVFPIDSVAKTVTASIVMDLVDEGVLDLDADVNDYLNEVEIEDTYPGEPVTLRHLLTHTAGFEEQVIGILADDSGTIAELEALLAEDMPRRVRPPGEVAAYSNHGLALAGLVAADAAGVGVGVGVELDELITERLFEPLGMDSSHAAALTPKALQERSATTYGPNGIEPVERFGDPLYPAGGAVATAADMGRYLQFQLGDGAPVFSEATMDEFHSTQFRHDPRLPGMALAFAERYRGETRMLSHGGDGPGSHSLLTLVPESDLGVYIVVNGDGWRGEGGSAIAAIESATDQILDGILGGEAGAAADGPAGAEAVEAPAEAAEAAAGTYRTTRMNDTDYTRLFLAMGSDVTVEVDGEGTVTTTGLSYDPDVAEQEWEPVGDGLYRERDGSALIAFGTLDGRTVLYNGSDAFQVVRWYENVMLHLGLAAAGLVLLLSQLVWPVVALVKRLRRRSSIEAERGLTGPKAATALASITAVLAAGFLAAFVAVAADMDQLTVAVLEGSPLVNLVSIPMLLAALGTVAMMCCVVMAWTRRWWGKRRRVHYTVVVLGAVAFTVVGHLYHFTIAPLALFG